MTDITSASGSNSRNLSNSHKSAAAATSTAPSSGGAGGVQRMSPFDELMAQHQQQLQRERHLLRIASARGGGQAASGGTSSHSGGHSGKYGAPRREATNRVRLICIVKIRKKY